MSGIRAAGQPRRATRVISPLVMAAVLAACTATASGSPTASPIDELTPTPSATAISTASPESSATVAATATPSATPSASASPGFAPPAGWTLPQAVGPALTCATYAESPVSAVIDAASAVHAAYACDGLIRLAESTDGARTWSVSTVKPPSGESDLDPQIAVDGNTLYVGYTRVLPQGGCGSTGSSSVSVWFRTRSVSGGAWSAPRQIGTTDDHLDALRVVGGTIHAALHGSASMSYVILHGSSLHRYKIADFEGMLVPALRVGDDGKARVAYEPTNGGIVYGTFNGSGFSTVHVTGSEEGWGPVLVLGASDAAYLLWNRSPAPGGCVTRGPEPTDGTYFSTNAGGAWQTSRLTPNVGEAALTVDVASGQVHALVSGNDANTCCPQEPGILAYFTGPAGGPWTQTILLPTEVESPLIKLDTATGTLLVIYEGTAGNGTTRIYAMTKR